MIDRRLLTAGLTAMAVTVTGCPGPGSGGFTLEELPTELAAVQCDTAERCGTGLDVYEQYVLREQITDCTAQLAGFLDASALGPIRAGVSAGTIVYHSDLAAGCLSAYTATGCGPTTGAPPAGCNDVFEGTIADGDPCSIGEECSNTSTCDSSLAGMCPSGVCVHVPQLGESCTTSCASGARCASGTCVAPVPAGGACNATTSGECVSGTSCIPGASDPTMGTCGTPTLAGEGEACGMGCEAGLVCSTSTRMCRQPRTDGTCEPVFGAGTDDCPSGQQCDGVDGAPGDCVPLPTTGEPCTTLCARGSRCVGSPGGAGECMVPVANGGACETDSFCQSSFCSAGVCAEPPLCRSR